MKYTIVINQYANKGFNLDLVDLALFDFIKSFIFSGRCDALTSEGKTYFWISPEYVIAEMPILGITTTRGINLRVEHLIQAGLLERHEDNKAKHRTYVCFGARFSEYEFGNENSADGTNIPSQPGTAVPRDYSISDNKETSISKDMNGKKFEERENAFHEECKTYASEFGYQMVEEFFTYWSEPNKSRTKMRFEQQTTWEIHRRMLTWAKHNFNRRGYSAPAPQRSISVEDAFKNAYGK